MGGWKKNVDHNEGIPRVSSRENREWINPVEKASSKLFGK